MEKAIRWRVSSDYIGCGSFVASRDRVVVGTDYGLQCVFTDRGLPGGWKADLGGRCVGVMQGSDGTLYASCVNGFHVLSPEGKERWGAHSLKPIVHLPVCFQEGVAVTSREAIHLYREWKGSRWRFDFCQVLGDSVEAIRVVNIFGMDPYIVAGVVDYDTGVGRVLVIHGRSGQRVWLSDPGPVTEVFPAGRGVFVWCESGYGKFETRMTRPDGHEIWRRDGAGVGSARPDGSVAMLIGSNESPAWDDWEYRQFSPGGKAERTFRVKGRCQTRPLCISDRRVFFIGTEVAARLSDSGTSYTRFTRMPQEELFEYAMGIRVQPSEGEIRVHELEPGSVSPRIRYRSRNTFSLVDPQFVDGLVVFCDGADVVAIDA